MYKSLQACIMKAPLLVILWQPKSVSYTIPITGRFAWGDTMYLGTIISSRTYALVSGDWDTCMLISSPSKSTLYGDVTDRFNRKVEWSRMICCSTLRLTSLPNHMSHVTFKFSRSMMLGIDLKRMTLVVNRYKADAESGRASHMVSNALLVRILESNTKGHINHTGPLLKIKKIQQCI